MASMTPARSDAAEACWPAAMTVETAARYTELSPRTIQKLLAQRALASFTIGRSRRIRRCNLDAFFSRRLASVSEPERAAVELRNRTGRSLV